MIIYPNQNSNTFCDLAITEQVISLYYPDKKPEWDLLTQETQVAKLLQSYQKIISCPNLSIPIDYGHGVASSEFILAQVFLTLEDLNVDVFAPNERTVQEEKIDVITIKYADEGSVTYQSKAFRMLDKHGCGSSSSSSFSQSSLKG